jgi:flagellar hook assembly protein FlgD
MYALQVSATDAAGNAASTEPFIINFEVSTEASVTHFYPYPNPFSTSTRFVFTLGGAQIPDQISIQIMTVSGKIVKEIGMDELGPIRIGNNISEFAWDGTDEYGDRLANGVYFYRVRVMQAGSELGLRESAGDQAFKNGYGKLYILR